jgi:hypothetical protein
MKTNALKSLIKEAVREELRASLPKLLKENSALESKKAPVKKSDFMEGISHAMNLQDQVKIANVSDKKKYSNKMSLSEALADTAGTGQRIPQDDTYPTMDQVFTTSNVPQAPTTSPDGRPVDLDAVPDSVMKNLNKDYSQLLQKVDEKSSARKV